MYLPHINSSNCKIPTTFYLLNFALQFPKSFLLYLLYPIDKPVHHKIYPSVYLAFHFGVQRHISHIIFSPNICNIVIILSLLLYISTTLSHSFSFTNIPTPPFPTLSPDLYFFFQFQ